MIRLQFNSIESRDAFATRFNLSSKVNATELDIGWHLLQFAKDDLDCVNYTILESDGEQEFIVKGDTTFFSNFGSSVKDMGDGFYLVKSDDGILLSDHVHNIEHNHAAVTFLANDCSISSMNAKASDIDPTSKEAQWARLRIASRYRPLATSYATNELNYKSKPELIVVDSGINFQHEEFNYDGLETENFYSFNGEFADDIGHGTAVASCAVGKNLGVATHLKLVNVKIASKARNASLLELGEALDKILARVKSDPTTTRIVNISWGIARSAWLDSKVEALLDAGITVICAAGNNGINVADISPAGIQNVITVGSIDKFDIPSGFNNISPTDAGITTGYGLSLDIFAPGENVIIAQNYSYSVGSGTSFATGLVSGAAVSLASLIESITPYVQLKNLLLTTATTDALLFDNDKFYDNQNRLVYLLASDQNVNQKINELKSYLGFLSDDIKEITFNIKSNLDVDNITNIFNGTTKFSIRMLDSDQSKYEPYFNMDDTGVCTISYPRFDMPADKRYEMVQFVVEAQTPTMKLVSPTIFFYDTNYNYKTTTESDITLALTNTNSISFYGSWGAAIK